MTKYLKDCESRPKEVVKVLSITDTEGNFKLSHDKQGVIRGKGYLDKTCICHVVHTDDHLGGGVVKSHGKERSHGIVDGRSPQEVRT